MLQFTNVKKARRVAIVAAVMTFATAGVAVAQQGAFPGLPPAQGGQTPGSMQNLQPVLARATQLQQAARLRQSAAPTGARTSYGAATQAFGDMLTALGSTAPASGSTDATTTMIPIVSSEQAASDVRTLKNAARKAGSAAETERLNKAASLYATGTKEFLTGQLREALLETAAEPVVIKGDSRAAEEAARKMNQPPAPKPAAPKPNTPPNPNTPGNPTVPLPPNDPANPQNPPVPNPNPNPPVPNPQNPPPVPPDPNNPNPPVPPPVPNDPNVPPVPNPQPPIPNTPPPVPQTPPK